MIWNSTQASQAPRTYLKVMNRNDNRTHILAANGDVVGRTEIRLNLQSDGVYYAELHSDGQNLDISYLGPGDNPF